MSLSQSVGAAVATLRRRPAELLPLYMLGAAVPAVVTVVPFLGIVVGYLYLEATGRLAVVREELAGADLEPPAADADPEAFEAWMTGLEPVIEPMLTPGIGLLLVVTFLASLLVLFVLAGAVAAGQLAACYGCLRRERGSVVGLVGARRFWARILGLYLLEVVCWILAAVVVSLAAAALALAIAVLAEPAVAATLVALPAALLAVVAFAAVRAVFAFAPVAVVVDDAGVFASVSNAAGFVRHRPVSAGFYYVVALGSLLALSTVAGLLALIDVVTVGTLLSTLVLFPFLDLLKTALYGGGRGRIAPPESVERPLRRQVVGGARAGWREMSGFVRSTPGIHGVTVVLALVTFAIGWMAAGPFAGAFETSIEARLEGHVPPAAALEFFANNWMVAITTAFGGLAAAVPAVVSLAFNGIVMGATARLEVAPEELAAFVLPHGIFEIPAILIAVALGISLGLVGVRYLCGRADRDDVADGLERAFWVSIGLGLLLAVAGAIEGFVSPYYYDLLL